MGTDRGLGWMGIARSLGGLGVSSRVGIVLTELCAVHRRRPPKSLPASRPPSFLGVFKSAISASFRPMSAKALAGVAGLAILAILAILTIDKRMNQTPQASFSCQGASVPESWNPPPSGERLTCASHLQIASASPDKSRQALPAAGESLKMISWGERTLGPSC